MPSRYALISFDVEEYDMPLEYNVPITPQQQLTVGKAGLDAVLEVLTTVQVPTTLFTTAHFANHYAATMQQAAMQHEIASHTYYHSNYITEHLLSSKLALQAITGTPVTGLRMPRLKQIPMQHVIAAGYGYDASINPTWLPGRYNHLHLPRTHYMQHGMLRIPASVSPLVRFPLFWLSFKNLPFTLYYHMLLAALRKDGVVSLYFHPWEFTAIQQYATPKYTRNPCGQQLLHKLHMLLHKLKQDAECITMCNYTQHITK